MFWSTWTEQRKTRSGSGTLRRSRLFSARVWRVFSPTGCRILPAMAPRLERWRPWSLSSVSGRRRGELRGGSPTALANSAWHELRKIEETPVGLRRAVTTEARCADLFVASCPRGAGLGKWAPLIEEVLLNGGHGLILLPEQFKSREAIDTVIIGWVNTREAARAIAEALPLLRLATSTRIVCVEEPAASPRRMMGPAEIAAHLDRQGVRGEVSTQLFQRTATPPR